MREEEMARIEALEKRVRTLIDRVKQLEQAQRGQPSHEWLRSFLLAGAQPKAKMLSKAKKAGFTDKADETGTRSP